MPLCETTIEEKHGRISKPAKANRFGPVKVSLINRMPVLEKKLKRKTLDVWELVSAFDHVRTFKQIPAALGIEDHPDLLNFKSMLSSQAVKVLTRIIYRCDRENLFRSVKPAMKHNEKEKQKNKTLRAKSLSRHRPK